LPKKRISETIAIFLLLTSIYLCPGLFLAFNGWTIVLRAGMKGKNNLDFFAPYT
jgi:hypothetical protein